MKRFLIIVFFIGCSFLVKAQDTSRGIQPLLDVIKELHDVYANNPSLSFRVLYTYADEASPSVILDSIPALMQVSTKGYHLKIGPTETIANNKYSIMLFSDDKIMYLAKPSVDSFNVDPMLKIDSALLKTGGLQTSVKNQKNIKIIDINFSEGSQYKSIELAVDKKSGHLLQSRFIVKSQSLQHDESSSIEKLNTGSGYAIIIANYYDYSTQPIDDSAFQEIKYFTRQGQNYTPTPEYKDYKIFIGSPNL